MLVLFSFLNNVKKERIFLEFSESYYSHGSEDT
jgi:hypothetical protein